MKCVVFLGFVIGLIVAYAQSATITREKRSICSSTKACLAPFPMLEEFVAKDNVKGLFAASFEVVLDQLCDKKQTLNRCLNNARCSDIEIAYTGTGVKETLDYICGDGKDKLLAHSKCFARDAFESGFKLCAKSLESEMSSMSTMVQLQLQTMAAYCPQFTKYFKCVENEVGNACSSTAADFVTTLTAKVFEPLASQVGCRLQF